jgi:hypothetical protein
MSNVWFSAMLWLWTNGVSMDPQPIVMVEQTPQGERLAAGWDYSVPPPGESWLASKAASSAAWWASYEAQRKAVPQVFDRPLEAPYIVVLAPSSGVGWAEGALDDGTPYRWQAHASPFDPAKAEAARLAEWSNAVLIVRDLDLTSNQVAAIRWYYGVTNRASLGAADQRKYDRIEHALVRAMARLLLRAIR